MTIPKKQRAFPGLWGLNVGILPNESRVVLEEEDENNETMAEGVEGYDKGVWMYWKGEPPDDLRYNVEGKKNCCMNREHAEDIFEASNRNISKVRNKTHNTIVQSKTQAKPINLSRNDHPQFQALNLRHELDMHSRPGTNRRKKRESSALVAAVHPTPKRDSVPQHWWENRSATALDDDRRWLLEELTGPGGFIDGKLRGLVFERWRARRHLAANLLLKYVQGECPVLVGRDLTPYGMEAEVTKSPH